LLLAWSSPSHDTSQVAVEFRSEAPPLVAPWAGKQVDVASADLDLQQ